MAIQNNTQQNKQDNQEACGEHAPFFLLLPLWIKDSGSGYRCWLPLGWRLACMIRACQLRVQEPPAKHNAFVAAPFLRGRQRSLGSEEVEMFPQALKQTSQSPPCTQAVPTKAPSSQARGLHSLPVEGTRVNELYMHWVSSAANHQQRRAALIVVPRTANNLTAFCAVVAGAKHTPNVLAVR